MNLVGAYDSDGDASDADSGGDSPPASVAPAGAAAPAQGKRKVDMSRLPCAKRLQLAEPAQEEEEAPLKRAAAIENARSEVGRSLLASLPKPRDAGISLGEKSGRLSLGETLSREVRIGDSAPCADLVPGLETDLPASAMNHPMFGGGVGKFVAAADMPTEEDLEKMRKTGKFVNINAADMVDPNWQFNASLDPTMKGNKLPEEVSAYERPKWNKTTHKDPSQVQKKKHQINWLAQEAMEKEAEMLDRSSSSRMSKCQTAMKYGW